MLCPYEVSAGGSIYSKRQDSRVRDAFGQYPQAHVTLGNSPGQGQELDFDDPNGPLPTQHILQSHENYHGITERVGYFPHLLHCTCVTSWLYVRPVSMKSLHTWLQKMLWKFSKLLSKSIHFKTIFNFFLITSAILKHKSFSRPRTSKILFSTELVLHCPKHKDTAECRSQFAFPSVSWWEY